MIANSDSNVFEDSEIVSSYTDEQAIDDGYLVRPLENPKGKALLLTSTLYERCKEIAKSRGVEVKQVIVPLLLDAQMIVKADPAEYLWTKGREGNATNDDVWIARNSMGGITLMFASDY